VQSLRGLSPPAIEAVCIGDDVLPGKGFHAMCRFRTTVLRGARFRASEPTWHSKRSREQRCINDVRTRIGEGNGNHQTMSLAGLGHAHARLPAETCAYAEADDEGAARGDGKGASGSS